MMRPLYALVASFGLVFLAAPVSADLAGPPVPQAAAPCWGSACDLINQACQEIGGSNCVGMAAEDGTLARCMGVVCKTINQVCIRVLGSACLG